MIQRKRNNYIVETKVTVRDVGVSVEEELTTLRELNPDWTYQGKVGNTEFFTLYVLSDEG